MSTVLSHFSSILVPMMIFYIVAYGVVSKCKVYEEFIKGAKSGLHTVFKIMPTLIALMVGVGILRGSGFLGCIGNIFEALLQKIEIVPEIINLIVIKLFSASAATGLLLDIYKTYGTDSNPGMMASLICSSTETVFYTLSVYFLVIKVTKTRWTLPGALLATASGIVASIVITGWM